MYRLPRSLLFALPPETAHATAILAAQGLGALPLRRPRRVPTMALLGLEFPNRIGLAAGLDKDAVAVAGLARLGFGFIEVGTVTPRPQPGNPRPRLFRLTADRALINRMGFNSAGAEAVAANLARLRPGPGRRPSDRIGVPIGVNIGKNRTTPLASAVADYRRCLIALYDLADYFTVNLSSPNTPGLRDLQAAASARELVAELTATRARLAAERGSSEKPLLVKVAPDLAAEDLRATAVAVLEAGADGFVAVNTTLARPGKPRSRNAERRGGLSGQPLFPLAVETVRRLRDCIGDGPAIIGVGGIAGVEDAAAMLDAGADLIQIYTALIFQGPALVGRLARATTA